MLKKQKSRKKTKKPAIETYKEREAPPFRKASNISEQKTPIIM